MKDKMIKDLEALIGEKDPAKIKSLRTSITENTGSGELEKLSKSIMQKVNMYIDTPDDHTREALEKVIGTLKEKE